MNEQQWLASENPTAMLAYWRSAHHQQRTDLDPPAQDRKLLLFACGCVRLCWDRLADDLPCGRCGGVGWHVHRPQPRHIRQEPCPDCAGTGRVNRSRRAVEEAERRAE